MMFISIALVAFMTATTNVTVIDPIITNPTGTYRFTERRTHRRGEMRVTLCDPKHIAIRLVVSSGAPAFDAGSLIDTLEYANNIAIYTDPNEGSSCRIVFQFSRSGTRIEEQRVGACSFGNGVAVAGFYRRVNRRARTF